jgi:hypothetical protein
MSNFKILSIFEVPGPHLSYQKCRQMCSRVKFTLPNLRILPFLVGICMGGTLRVLGCQISKLCVFILVPGPQNSYQKWHHICSTVKFVEQNFHFPILSRNARYGGTLRTQNFKFLSAPLSIKHKIAEQKCNQICSTVKYVTQI